MFSADCRSQTDWIRLQENKSRLRRGIPRFKHEILIPVKTGNTGGCDMYFYSTKDLCDILHCKSRTVFRRMKREFDPLPAPCIKQRGACNLWDRKEVDEWIEREKKRCKEAA